MAGTPGLPVARIRDQREAEAWLITERANLIATVLDALTQSDSTARLAVRLTELLQWYLYPYARARELWTLGEAVVRTARRLGDREGEAWALPNLSAVYWLHRQFDRMRQCLEAALVIWREAGDREGERRSLHNLADALTEMQSYEESVALQTRQLDLAREAGDVTAQVTGLGDPDRAYRGLGRFGDALTCFEESFQHARKIGDSSLQSFALHEISALCFEQGRNQEAHEYLERAGILGRGHLTTYVSWRGHAWSAFFPACLSLRISPDILEGDVLRDNPQYREPEDLVGDLDRLPLTPPPQPAAMMRILPTELHAVRAFVADQAKRCGLSADALHNLLVAVTEVATNAIRHGDAPVTLRTWPDDGLICEITDSRQLAARGVHQLAAARVRGGLRLRTLGGRDALRHRAGADRIERDDGTAAERLSGGCAAASGCPDGFRIPARGRASGLGRGAVQPTRQWAIRVSNGRSRNRPVGRQMSSGSHGGHHPEHHWRTHALMVEGDAWHSSSIQ